MIDATQAALDLYHLPQSIHFAPDPGKAASRAEEWADLMSRKCDRGGRDGYFAIYMAATAIWWVEYELTRTTPPPPGHHEKPQDRAIPWAWQIGVWVAISDDPMMAAHRAVQITYLAAVNSSPWDRRDWQIVHQASEALTRYLTLRTSGDRRAR